MLEKRNHAIHYFVKALQIDPNLTIDAKDLFNTSSAENFNQARLVHTGSQGQAAIGSKLYIESNLKNASIAIDGKVVGRVFQKIDVKPGINKLEIFLPGSSIRRKFRIPVKAGFVNEFIIILNKSPTEDSARSKRIYKEQIRDSFDDNTPAKDSDIIPEAAFVLTQSKDRTPKKSRSDSSPKPPKNKSLSWVHFTPFGGGHFYSNQLVIGGISALTQVTLAYLAYDSFEESNKLFKDSNKIIAQKKAENESEEKINQFRSEAKKLIDEADFNTSMYVAGFFLTWGLSALHVSYSLASSELANQNQAWDSHNGIATIHSDRSARFSNLPQTSWELALRPRLYTDSGFAAKKIKPGIFLELNSQF